MKFEFLYLYQNICLHASRQIVAVQRPSGPLELGSSFISFIKVIAVEIYVIFNDMGPDHLLSLFSKSNILYQLRDNNKSILPL